MTDYQRGNRDGLLSAAKAMDNRAATYQSSGDRLDRRAQAAGLPMPAIQQANRLRDADWRVAAAYTEAARTLRVLAEALPVDPEAP